MTRALIPAAAIAALFFLIPKKAKADPEPVIVPVGPIRIRMADLSDKKFSEALKDLSRWGTINQWRLDEDLTAVWIPNDFVRKQTFAIKWAGPNLPVFEEVQL